jgi:hypothetical protein
MSVEPPVGWVNQGCLHFNVKCGDTIGNILSHINEYRSPRNKITSLYDENKNILPSNYTIPMREVTYYV